MSSGELERVEIMGRVGSGGLKLRDAGGHVGAELSPDETTVAAVSAAVSDAASKSNRKL